MPWHCGRLCSTQRGCCEHPVLQEVWLLTASVGCTGCLHQGESVHGCCRPAHEIPCLKDRNPNALRLGVRRALMHQGARVQAQRMRKCAQRALAGFGLVGQLYLPAALGCANQDHNDLRPRIEAMRQAGWAARTPGRVPRFREAAQRARAGCKGGDHVGGCICWLRRVPSVDAAGCHGLKAKEDCAHTWRHSTRRQGDDWSQNGDGMTTHCYTCHYKKHKPMSPHEQCTHE